MSTSAITAAEEAFTVLAACPAPLAFDARGIPGLPDRHLDLLQLRDLLTDRGVPAPVVDTVWRRLTVQARNWGPAWVVAAVGMAVPGLTRLAARLTAGHAAQSDDIASEVVAGFLHELRTTDLDPPRVWLRLLWAAWRAGLRARQVRDFAELPDDLPAGASTPRVPYGHPDLLLGRAVAAGILTRYEADLIGDTRLGDVLVDQLADQQGVSAAVLRMRRNRAERRLLAALARGYNEPVLTVSPVRSVRVQARLDGLCGSPAPTRQTATGAVSGHAGVREGREVA
jgi:hypothetical protein